MLHKRAVHFEIRTPCTDCDKSFFDKHAMMKHKRVTHDGIIAKRHTCNSCDKAYRTKRQLSEHTKAVHLNVEYSYTMH